MATGAAGRAMSATTRLRRGSIRSSRPPEAGAPAPTSAPQATQTVSRVALTEIDPASGPPSGILATTLLLSGRSPTGRPGRPPAPRRRPPRRPRRPGRSRSRHRDLGRDRVGGRVDAGDLVAAGHPEATGARGHAVGEAAGRDGGHHRRRLRRRDGIRARRSSPAPSAPWRCGVARRPPGPSPPARPPRPARGSRPATDAAARHGAGRRRGPRWLGGWPARRRPRGRPARPVPMSPRPPPGSRATAERSPRERPAAAARAGQPHPTRAARPGPRRAPRRFRAGWARPRRRGPAGRAGRRRPAVRREVTGVGGRGPREARGGAARRHPAGLVARPCRSPSRPCQAPSSSWRRTRDTASPSPTVRITESSRSSAAMRRA